MNIDLEDKTIKDKRLKKRQEKEVRLGVKATGRRECMTYLSTSNTTSLEAFLRVCCRRARGQRKVEAPFTPTTMSPSRSPHVRPACTRHNEKKHEALI